MKKQKFKKGDIVKVKGLEDGPTLVIEAINWDTTETGSLKQIDGRPVLRSISAKFFDDKGNIIVKEFHSNELIPVENLGMYYLEKALNLFKKQNRVIIAQEISKLIKVI